MLRVSVSRCAGETELTGGGMGVPSPPSFDLISLFRTPNQTEIQT